MDLKGCSRKCPSSLNLKTRLREVLTACRRRRAQRTENRAPDRVARLGLLGLDTFLQQELFHKEFLL